MSSSQRKETPILKPLQVRPTPIINAQVPESIPIIVPPKQKDPEIVQVIEKTISNTSNNSSVAEKQEEDSKVEEIIVPIIVLLFGLLCCGLLGLLLKRCKRRKHDAYSGNFIIRNVPG